MAPKRPDYGDATPEDLARALLSAPADAEDGDDANREDGDDDA